MKKEEINLIAQLLIGIKDAIAKLEAAEKKNDSEKILAAKREILNFQRQIDKLL